MDTNFNDNDKMLSLKGKNILVTGVSRLKGIGASIAKLLASAGANVIVDGYSNYDKELQYPDADEDFVSNIQKELSIKGDNITLLEPSDLTKKDMLQEVIELAKNKFGYS